MRNHGPTGYDQSFGFIVSLIGLGHDSLHERIAIQLQHVVELVDGLDADHVGDALTNLLPAHVREGVEDGVVEGLQLYHMFAQ